MAAYAIHYLHKDNTQHFANLRRELVGFTELKEAVKQDPAAITDPALRAKAEKQIRAAYAAAQADVDHRLAKVNETIQTVVALAEVTVAFLQIIFALAALVGDPEFQKAAKSIRTGLVPTLPRRASRTWPPRSPGSAARSNPTRTRTVRPGTCAATGCSSPA